MKSFKKKIIWFIVLIILAVVVFVGWNNDALFSMTNSSSEMLEFSMESFWTAIGIEAFVTIHMSVFVLMPLSRLINSQKSMKVFGILFVIRLIILLIGDLFIPMLMMMIDFMSVFFGAFILVPVAGFTKMTVFKNGISFNEYPEVEFDELSRIGFSDDELLKKALVQQYTEIKTAICDFNYERLESLCTSEQYILYKNEMNLLKQVDEKNEFLDFEVKDTKIYSVSMDKEAIRVSIVVKFECLEFTVDRYNKIVRGNDRNKKDVMVELSFMQAIDGNITKICPSCAAPIKDGHVEFCGYCGTALNYKVGGWVLLKEKRVYEK